MRANAHNQIVCTFHPRRKLTNDDCTLYKRVELCKRVRVKWNHFNIKIIFNYCIHIKVVPKTKTICCRTETVPETQNNNISFVVDSWDTFHCNIRFCAHPFMFLRGDALLLIIRSFARCCSACFFFFVQCHHHWLINMNSLSLRRSSYTTGRLIILVCQQNHKNQFSNHVAYSVYDFV